MDSSTTARPRPGTGRRPAAGRRALLAAYAVLGYLVAVAALGYLAGFLTGLVVPRDIDGGTPPAVWQAVLVDVTLILAFGAQHSLMARAWFKQAWSRVMPPEAERTTYLLATGLVLLVLFVFWQPVPAVVWQVHGAARTAVLALFLGGVTLLLAATFQVSHTDLFGLRQAWSAIRGIEYTSPAFTRAGLYRLVRHPIMTGMLLMLWVAPTMSVGHLLLSTGLSVYILIGTRYEEADLRATVGHGYLEYRRSVPAFLPWPARRSPRTGPPSDSAAADVVTVARER